jgi:hypothetical protein
MHGEDRVMTFSPLALRNRCARAHKIMPLHQRASRQFGSADNSKTQNADQDQVDGDDEIQETRDQQDQNAGNQGDDGLEMGDRDGHGVPRCSATDDGSLETIGKRKEIRQRPDPLISARLREGVASFSVIAELDPKIHDAFLQPHGCAGQARE